MMLSGLEDDTQDKQAAAPQRPVQPAPQKPMQPTPQRPLAPRTTVYEGTRGIEGHAQPRRHTWAAKVHSGLKAHV